MTEPPPPERADLPVAERARRLAALVGRERFTAVCVALLEGAPREQFVAELRHLTNHPWDADDAIRDHTAWRDHWVRTWGARGLLHVWDGTSVATAAIVRGVGDPHWRPAEMCLKVATAHEVGEAGPGAAALVGADLPRVRAQALRTLGAVGDTEHVDAVRDGLDDPDAGVRRAASLALDRLALRLDLRTDGP